MEVRTRGAAGHVHQADQLALEHVRALGDAVDGLGAHVRVHRPQAVAVVDDDHPVGVGMDPRIPADELDDAVGDGAHRRAAFVGDIDARVEVVA